VEAFHSRGISEAKKDQKRSVIPNPFDWSLEIGEHGQQPINEVAVARVASSKMRRKETSASRGQLGPQSACSGVRNPRIVDGDQPFADVLEDPKRRWQHAEVFCLPTR